MKRRDCLSREMNIMKGTYFIVCGASIVVFRKNYKIYRILFYHMLKFVIKCVAFNIMSCSLKIICVSFHWIKKQLISDTAIFIKIKFHHRASLDFSSIKHYTNTLLTSNYEMHNCRQHSRQFELTIGNLLFSQRIYSSKYKYIRVLIRFS